jgi:hypothetical protein
VLMLLRLLQTAITQPHALVDRTSHLAPTPSLYLQIPADFHMIATGTV